MPGFSGDVLRLRSAGFGSPDEWLTRTQADVVFAFFGYNESHAGPAGLEKFRADLAQFIEHTRGQKHNRKGGEAAFPRTEQNRPFSCDAGVSSTSPAFGPRAAMGNSWFDRVVAIIREESLVQLNAVF